MTSADRRAGGARRRSPAIERVVVVVPARDERADIEACLTGIDRASAGWGGPVSTIIAADCCTDDTAELVRAWTSNVMSVEVVEGRWASVGRARRAASVVGLRRAAGVDPRHVWLANTDADSVVPVHWLTHQVGAAGLGADVVLGTVALDDAATPHVLRTAFAAAYRCDGEVHAHVHGANLGIRASTYRAVGGWDRGLAVGEDHDLVRRCTTAGFAVHRPATLTVTTSSRTVGRTPAGFASVLADLRRTAGEVRDQRRGPATTPPRGPGPSPWWPRTGPHGSGVGDPDGGGPTGIAGSAHTGTDTDTGTNTDREAPWSTSDEAKTSKTSKTSQRNRSGNPTTGNRTKANPAATGNRPSHRVTTPTPPA